MKGEVYFPFFAKSVKLKLLFTVKSCQGAFPAFDVSLFSPLSRFPVLQALTQCPKYHGLLDFCPCILDFRSFSTFSLRNGYRLPKSRLYSPPGACFQRSQAELVPAALLDTSGISQHSVMSKAGLSSLLLTLALFRSSLPKISLS